MNKQMEIKFEVVFNNNISVLGVFIGMDKDDAIGKLNKYRIEIFPWGIKLPDFNLTFRLDEEGFVNGIFAGICDNGDSKLTVDNFFRYHKMLLNKKFRLISEDKNEKENGGVSVWYRYSSGPISFELLYDRKVSALSGRNATALNVKFLVGKDSLGHKLNGRSYVKNMYERTVLNSNINNNRFDMPWYKILKVIVIIVALVIAFLYVQGERYYIGSNGIVVDKWTHKAFPVSEWIKR